MNKVIDTRGLSCPQPVMMTLDEINGINQGNVTVLVDTDTSRENVLGVAERFGWQVTDVKAEGAGFKITITKS